MSACKFTISATNPNPAAGCLCGETPPPDAAGPYAIFYATETDSAGHMSPHAVLCAGCALGCVNQFAEGELLDVAPAEVTTPPEPITHELPTQRESPELDQDGLIAALEDDEELTL